MNKKDLCKLLVDDDLYILRLQNESKLAHQFKRLKAYIYLIFNK